MKPKGFLTTSTAAEELNLSRRTITQWCQRGQIKAYKMGKMFLIDRKYWEEWKARNIVSAS